MLCRTARPPQTLALRYAEGSAPAPVAPIAQPGKSNDRGELRTGQHLGARSIDITPSFRISSAMRIPMISRGCTGLISPPWGRKACAESGRPHHFSTGYLPLSAPLAWLVSTKAMYIFWLAAAERPMGNAPLRAAGLLENQISASSAEET